VREDKTLLKKARTLQHPEGEGKGERANGSNPPFLGGAFQREESHHETSRYPREPSELANIISEGDESDGPQKIAQGS